MTIKQAKHLAKKNESAKRYAHTRNVAALAVCLAKRYGADEEKAELAALLHDAAKEFPRNELLRILQDNGIIAQGTENRPFSVWHGVCASILAQTEWGVTDPDVLSAVACHTTGKPQMSLLDKIIFLADMLSEERDFEGVEALRALALDDIDRAMCAALKSTLDCVQASGKPLDTYTLAAYHEYQKNED